MFILAGISMGSAGIMWASYLTEQYKINIMKNQIDVLGPGTSFLD
jgi:hypothetical protein